MDFWKVFGSIFQQFVSLNIQNTFPWLLLNIYTGSVIFVSPLLKSFNCKSRRCKHCVTFRIFT